MLHAGADTHDSHILLVGDFNHPNIEWTEDGALQAGDRKSRAFVEAVQNSYLYQHVTQPTRARSTQNPSLLDLVMTNEQDMVSDVQHLAPLGNSDHCVLSFKFTCYTEHIETRTKKYVYHRGDYRAMRRDLTLDWDDMFRDCEGDPDKQYQLMLQKLLESQKRHIPMRRPPKKGISA